MLITLLFYTRKTNLLRNLREIHNFQALYLVAPAVISETVNHSAKGFMVDMNLFDTALDFK